MFHIGSGWNELDFPLTMFIEKPLDAVLWGNLPTGNAGGSLCVQLIIRALEGPFAFSGAIAATSVACLQGTGPVNSAENVSPLLSPLSFGSVGVPLVAVWAQGNAEVDSLNYNIAP
jgi:hypothetical protein